MISRKLYLFAAMAVLIMACGKDKFETTPQIKIKSVSGNVVPLNGTLTVNLSFTDKEGDISEGRLVYKVFRLNKRPLPIIIPPFDTVSTILPKFPKEVEGQIQVYLKYTDLHRSDIENDTVVMRFVAYDKAMHKSDTATSEKIVVLKN